MIVYDNINFLVANHGAPFCGPWNRQMAIKTWFGVTGSLAVLGKVTHREITVEVTLSEFRVNGELETAVQQMANLLNSGRSGLLIIDGVRYPKATFMGWEPAAPPFYCGTGVNFWTQFGKLSWLQSS